MVPALSLCCCIVPDHVISFFPFICWMISLIDPGSEDGPPAISCKQTRLTIQAKLVSFDRAHRSQVAVSVSQLDKCHSQCLVSGLESPCLLQLHSRWTCCSICIQFAVSTIVPAWELVPQNIDGTAAHRMWMQTVLSLFKHASRHPEILVLPYLANSCVPSLSLRQGCPGAQPGTSGF